MRAWERHAEHRTSGEWHVHTSFTDGTATVDELCGAAERSGIPLIAFTEHVRRSPDYDFRAFLDQIDLARGRYGLTILSGVEAKVLPDGSLDVDDDILASVDYPIFAYHSFPADKELFFGTLHDVITSGRAHAWAHPGTFSTRTGITLAEDELNEIMELMARYRVAMEINTKYLTPDASWARAAREAGVAIVRGSDIHSLKDLAERDERWSKMSPLL